LGGWGVGGLGGWGGLEGLRTHVRVEGIHTHTCTQTYVHIHRGKGGAERAHEFAPLLLTPFHKPLSALADP
jgi:hypothetical protein